MLSIGNKKYRNLQEQVGFNTEQIEKIFDVLDGLAVTDNVVAIADLSDNLNADQLEIVQKSVAFLVYAGQLYIKKSEDASNAYFDIVFTISSSGGVISFNSKEIEVDLSTGALSQTTSTNSTYSSSQIDTLVGAKADTTYVDTQLALKADLSGATFTGNVVLPSINGETTPSVKPIYWHTVKFQRGGTVGSTVSRCFGQMIILNNSPTPIDATSFMNALKQAGFYGVVVILLQSTFTAEAVLYCNPISS